jgi:hypothetical protein
MLIRARPSAPLWRSGRVGAERDKAKVPSSFIVMT